MSRTARENNGRCRWKILFCHRIVDDHLYSSISSTRLNKNIADVHSQPRGRRAARREFTKAVCTSPRATHLHFSVAKASNITNTSRFKFYAKL